MSRYEKTESALKQQKMVVCRWVGIISRLGHDHELQKKNKSH